MPSGILPNVLRRRRAQAARGGPFWSSWFAVPAMPLAVAFGMLMTGLLLLPPLATPNVVIASGDLQFTRCQTGICVQSDDDGDDNSDADDPDGDPAAGDIWIEPTDSVEA